MEFKKQLFVEKPIVKGYNFLKSGKVLALYSKTDNGVFYVKSQVMQSYSTSGPVYAVKVILSGSAEVKKAHCPCPAQVCHQNQALYRSQKPSRGETRPTPQLVFEKGNACYFIVSSDSETHTDTIGFDSSFWNQVLPKLEDFYFEHIFPEPIYPRIYCKEESWNKTLPFPRLE